MQEELSVFVIEDSGIHRDVMVELVTREADLRLVGLAGSVQEAREKLNESKCNLILLDIELPDGSGIDLLGGLEHEPYVIFTTMHEEYAVRAFEIGALDYLIKPITGDRFRVAIERARRFTTNPSGSGSGSASTSMSPTTVPGLVVSEKNRRDLIPFHELIYLSSHGKYTVVHAREREFKTLKYLGRVEEELPDNFLRIHKQFIINPFYLSHLLPVAGGRGMAVLKDEDETALPVGRKSLPRLKEYLGLA